MMPSKRETSVSRIPFKVFASAGAIGVAVSLGFLAGRSLSPGSAARSLKGTPQSSSFSSVDPGTWVVNVDPGPNVPPIGRSVFDHLTMVDDGHGSKKQVIPFPFQNLVALIQSRVRPEAATPGYGLKNVLIPLGRSLQRSASAPDFFVFPRVVVGVDGYPIQDADGSVSATGAFLRDRLFVGYNEKASVLEIVSYNEAAGRFEFQVAHDYKEGSSAQAVYANRSVCLSCHQNATPIFSDRPWQETNANPEVTSRLQSAMAAAHPSGFDGQRYMGVPLAVPEAQPQGVDNAKFRANLIPATHFLWQRLCDAVDGSAEGSARCRGQALALALRMGLTNQLDESSPLFFARDTSEYLSVLAATWKRQWPSGLLISSPRIPNRNPFEKPKNPGPYDVTALDPTVAGELGNLIKSSNIPAEFEPLNKRGALDKWSVLTANAESAPDISGLAIWLRQLVGFFTDFDFARIDRWAAARAVVANSRAQATGACEIESAEYATRSKISFSCQGAGAMDPLRLAGFISWDSSAAPGGSIATTGALEALAVRTAPGCDLAEGTESAACPEAKNLVLKGTLTQSADGVYQATLSSTNRINSLRTRFSDGNLLESVTLRWKKGTQVAVAANILRDFPFIEQAIAQAVQETSSGQSNVLSKRPFRRTSVLSYLRSSLGGARTEAGDCCEADGGMPAPRSDEAGGVIDSQLAKIVGPAAPFLKECAVCHRNNGGFPPNYLTGSVSDIQKQLSLCAERIWFRINMYDVAKAERGQSPMPPVSRLDAIEMSESQWRQSASLASLRAATAEILKAKGIEPPNPKTMNYQSLPACFGNSF